MSMLHPQVRISYRATQLLLRTPTRCALGPPDTAGRLCDYAVCVPSTPKGVSPGSEQAGLRHERDDCGLGLAGHARILLPTPQTDKLFFLSWGETNKEAGRSWLDCFYTFPSQREAGKLPLFMESGGVGNT